MCLLMLSEVDGRLGRATLSVYRLRLRQPRNLQRYRIDCTLERIASADRALISDKAAEHRGATVKLMMLVYGVLPMHGLNAKRTESLVACYSPPVPNKFLQINLPVVIFIKASLPLSS